MTEKALAGPPTLVFSKLPIETERLIMRPFTMDDLAANHAYNSLPEVARFLPYTPRDMEQAKTALEIIVATTEGVEEGEPLVLAVEEKSTGAVMGEVMIFYHSAASRQAEVGYVFHSDFHGKGYAFEAADKIVDVCFSEFGMHRITGRCAAANDPSAKLLEKLGMRQEGLFREYKYYKGGWGNLKVFAILEDEWRTRKKKIKPRGRSQ